MNKNLSQIIKFLISGGITTVGSYIIYLILLLITTYTLAYTLSFVCGIFISYLLNSLFVFNKKLNIKTAGKYPIVYLIQYLVGISCLYVLVEILTIDSRVAPLIVIFITIPITFVLSKKVITTP